MKLKKTYNCFKTAFFLSWLVIFLFTGKLFSQSASLPTDRARVTIQNIPDYYNPTGPQLKVLRTDANTPLRAGTAWIWEKQGQEEPESYYQLMTDNRLNAVRIIQFDTWEVETYTPSPVFTPTDWEDPSYRTRQLARLERAVNFASKYGMYVIIDSHNAIPNYNEAYTNALWKYVAPHFANRTHVLFELANEPMSGIGRNGDMDMGAAGATSSPRLQALKRSYDIARAGAPNTMLMILTPPGINDAAFGTGMGNLADSFAQLPGTTVDWTKTAVSYHLYGNDAAWGAATNAANLRNLHQRYAGWPSENSFPSDVYVFQGDEWRSPSFDNDQYVNQTCEKLGIGWSHWFINGTTQFNANFPTLWADAVAKGWAWAADPITPVTPIGVKLTGTVIGTLGTWGGGVSDDRSTVFDGNTATFFDCTTADYAWAGLDLGSAKVITSLRYYPRSNYPGRMTNGVFEGSNTADFSSGVVTLSTIGSQPAVAWTTLTISNPTGFRYVRYKAPVGGYGNVAEVEFYANDTQAPTAPTGLTSTGNTSSRLTLNWTASTDNAGVVSYEIFNGTTSLGTSTTTSFVVTGLTPGTAYTFTVKAKDAANNISVASSAASNANTLAYDVVIPFASTAPVIDGTKEASWNGTLNSIANLSMGAVANSTDLSGNWNASWDNTNLYLFVDVTDDVLKVDGPNWYDDDRIEILIDADGNRGTTYSAKDYQYYIRRGETTISETKYNATANVQVSNVAVTGGYRLEVKIPFATLGITPASLNKLGVDVQVADDDDGGTADGKLAWYALNDNSWSDPSLFGVAQLGAEPIDTQAPTVPAGLISSAITATSFTLSWTASTDNVAVTGYEVFKNGVSVGTTASTSMSITGLTSGVTYSMTVKSRDAVPNWSAESTALPVTTTDNVAPSIPTGLISSAITATSFTLSWTASTDNVAVTGYEVFKNGVSVGTTASTSMSITGLASGVTYSMTVKSRDAVPNWSAESTILNVTSSSPTYPIITARGDNSGAGEGKEKAFNGITTDKWLDFSPTSWIQIQNATATAYDKYVIVSGNDSPARDPKNWTVQASNNGSTWTTLSTQINQTFVARNTAYAYTFTNSTAYSYYKLDITANNGDTNTQLAEITYSFSKYEAESAVRSGGIISTDYTGYSGSGFWANVASVGNSCEFTVNVASAGSTNISCRYSAGNANQTLSLYVNGIKIKQVSFTKTTDWNSWADKVDNVSLNAGNNTVKYQYDSGDNGYINIDYISVSAAAVDAQAPTAPTALTGSAIATSSFTLSWTASTDNVAVTGYEVFKDSVLYSTVATTTASITGLTPGVTYQMTVKAKDAAGNASALSAAKSVQTSSNNILLNPGFENGTTSWTGQYGCTLTAGTTFHSGTMGGSVTARSYPSSSAEQTITSAIASLGGGNYYLEAWVKMASGSSTVKATFKYRYNNTDYYLGVQGVVGTTWTKLSGTVNVAYTGTLQFAQFYLETTSGATSFFVDDCIVNSVGQLRVSKFNGEESDVNIQGNKGENLRIYPNPVSTELNISNVDLDSRISIFGIDGRLVKRFNSEQTDLSINVSTWDKGVYFLNVQNGKQNKTSKFIVR